jgi:hypothetical protein
MSKPAQPEPAPKPEDRPAVVTQAQLDALVASLREQGITGGGWSGWRRLR